MVRLLQQPLSIPGVLRLEANKTQSLREPLRRAAIPERLIVPLSQHIGEPAEAVVSVGDHVLRGQLIARPRSYISAPVHAPTSGTVTDIGDYPVPHPSGLKASCIVIHSDGKDQAADTGLAMDDVFTASPAEIRQRVRDAGIVGLGGAGFPTAVKLNPGPDHGIELLVINAMECEPYISCDEALMCHHGDDIIAGVRILQQALGARQAVIGLEDNMPEALRCMQEALQRSAAGGISITVLPSIYPAGGEKQLIYALTGAEVPSQGLPAELGIVCHNVGTAHAVARALLHGEALISRIVTVTGAGVRQPANLEVRIGTPMSALIAACGGYSDEVTQLLMGGPMMGIALPGDELPVIKTSNCLLAASAAETPRPRAASACIRCGQCADVCPARLLPQQLYWYAHGRDFDKIQDYNLFDCIECGCCAQVCPSHIPLVQYYRFAKTEIWELEREKLKADAARQRHEFRLERLGKEKQALAERRASARQVPAKEKVGDADAKQAEIAAALARVQARKAQQDAAALNTDNLTAEQQASIAAIDKHRAARDEPAGH